MQIKIFIALLLVMPTFKGLTQSKTARKYAKTITTKDLYSHLSVLASDSLEGRETGTKGQKKAADYVSNYFQTIELKGAYEEENNPYFQSFTLQQSEYHSVYLRKDREKKNNFEDFLLYTSNETYGEEIIEVVFAGYGDSLSNIDVDNKYVAFINKEWSDFRQTLLQAQGWKCQRLYFNH